MTRQERRQQVRETVKKYQQTPALFFRKALGVPIIEDYQERILDAVAKHDRVCVAACHDLGKTFTAARLAMWFLNCFPNSKVITTAPTFNQVEKILWSEIRAAHGKAKWPLGGRLNMTDWTFNPEWFALGFSPRNEVSGGEGQGTSSSFQGFHAPYIFILFDEATGIPPNVWIMAEGLLTSHFIRFVAIGNPTSRSSEFFRCFKSPDWHKIYLTCFDSPNLKANGINNEADLKKEIEKVTAMSDADYLEYVNSYKVVRGYLLTAKWVVQQARKWGLKHPLTVSKILGKFPEASDNTLLPLGEVEEAQRRVVWPTKSCRTTLGVDVARYGTDSTVITAMKGRRQTKRDEHFHLGVNEVVGEVIALVNTLGDVDVIVVDETGIGGGVVDLLEEAQRNGIISKDIEIRGVQFGAGVDCDTEHECTQKGQHIGCNKAKYSNMKARMFGLLQNDLPLMQLLNEAVYLEELPTIIYRYDSKGRMVIESKDEYKKRTGRKSPDSADSLALANFGHYDEITFGKFMETKGEKKETVKPRASGLRNNDKQW